MNMKAAGMNMPFISVVPMPAARTIASIESEVEACTTEGAQTKATVTASSAESDAGSFAKRTPSALSGAIHAE